MKQVEGAGTVFNTPHVPMDTLFIQDITIHNKHIYAIIEEWAASSQHAILFSVG